ncbi:zinc-binding alcohol dehydrogenase family protein [Aspergillus affinis]|uniref:zinc-binding alcohol dehydrogenase family protein n=1 Tax=Aspergillus affinis TaxID=1070780 RepID=UPI0022FE527E|nr:GroES-like protein [Aspergillus affinis]KAI9043178.1 GroES-like protein [Aspergillus affinis]
MSNQAAWIKEKHGRLVLDEAEIPIPGENEVLVKVDLIAFSPIESKIQTFGTHPIPYPNILGQSFAGTVQSIGPNVTSYKPGDRIASNRGAKAVGDPRFGSYQKYALASVSSSSKIAPDVDLQGAATSIVNLAAVVSALSIYLGLDRPPLSGKPEPKSKKVLIYGGSSSTGGLAVRYAVTAGYTVVTTSSPQNREFVESLNPAYIIDHTAPAETIVEELRSQGPFDSIFDTIGLPPVTNILIKYISSIGGGKYNSLIPPIGGEDPMPDNVERLFAPYSRAFEDEANREIARWLFEEYLPNGLQSGLVVPTRAQVVEGGLDNAQQALDLMTQNAVSGHKLILNPWAGKDVAVYLNSLAPSMTQSGNLIVGRYFPMALRRVMLEVCSCSPVGGAFTAPVVFSSSQEKTPAVMRPAAPSSKSPVDGLSGYLRAFDVGTVVAVGSKTPPGIVGAGGVVVLGQVTQTLVVFESKDGHGHEGQQ